jgi:hypothetical protein
MQYRYTVRGGYDRLIKKKVEKGTLFAVPVAIMTIVGFAALTSNTTTGPGVGSPSKGAGSGQSTVTKTFKTTANDQPDKNSTGTATGAQGTGDSLAQGGSSASSASGASGINARSIQPSSSSGSTVSSLPVSPTSGTTGGGTPSGSGGGGTPSQDCLCQALSPVTSVVQPVLQTVQDTTAPLTSTLPTL